MVVEVVSPAGIDAAYLCVAAWYPLFLVLEKL